MRMDYSCSGSGAYSSDVDDALEDEFDYSTTTYYANYNYNTVRSEIANSRPVYLSGNSGGGTGHAFVAHGYWIMEIYECEEHPYYPGEFWERFLYSYLYFYINWGWYGDYDGYFAFDDFTPGPHNYNSNKKMVVVRP